MGEHGLSFPNTLLTTHYFRSSHSLFTDTMQPSKWRDIVTALDVAKVTGLLFVGFARHTPARGHPMDRWFASIGRQLPYTLRDMRPDCLVGPLVFVHMINTDPISMHSLCEC